MKSARGVPLGRKLRALPNLSVRYPTRGRATRVVNTLANLSFCLYTLTMEFDWDETKRRANIEKHGVDFIEAERMLGGMPSMLEDGRRDYGERRCLAVGEEAGRLLVVVFTVREGVFRIISARKANARERSKYAD